MRRLLVYIRRYRGRYAFGILCTFATATLAMTIPRLSGSAIDAIARDNLPRLEHLSLLMIAAALMMGVVRWFSRFTLFNCGRDVEYDLRNDLFAHLCRLSPDFFERIKTGDLMSRMINDLTAVRMMVGMGILSFTNTPLYYIYALIFMLSLSLKLTLASMAPYLVLFVIIRWLTRTLMARSLAVQEGLGSIGARVQESLSGIHVIKAYALEDREAGRFADLNDEYNEQGLALARVRGALMPIIKAAAGTSVMVVLIYGGTLVRAREITIGDLVAFMGFLGQLAWPTVSLGWMISIYQRGKASMKRLEDIFQATPAASVAGDESRVAAQGAITWENVWFGYGDALQANGHPGQWAVRDLNVTVPAGAKLAIVGRTGAGKSTMVKLLTRLLEPTRGRLLLDGREIHDLPLKALRKTVSMVPQEPTLFSDTIARNIAFGHLDAALGEIQAAARTAGLEGDIAVMPRGFDTIVGERGMALSGGQKQRVTIARLLTYGPAVVILDDALSSVDTETEKAVLNSLSESVQGRTTIVVAHRASTVRDADEIIVLDDGAIAERGTHQELMARHGIYAELFHRQLLEEELDRY